MLFRTQGARFGSIELGYTFLVFCLGAGPIVALTRIAPGPFLRLVFTYLHRILIRLSCLASFIP